MTVKEDEDIVVNAEPDATLATAVGVEEKVTSGGKNNEPPIPPNHSRYYCSKCRAVSIVSCMCFSTYIFDMFISGGYCFDRLLDDIYVGCSHILMHYLLTHLYISPTIY